MPDLHRFYFPNQLKENSTIVLDEASAKHIWQVLRMEAGGKVSITNGKGSTATGTIQVAERHSCEVLLTDVVFEPRKKHILHLCVAFTKNNSRNEWLLEKAAELGVTSITPVMAVRSEKVHFRQDRWEKILNSALLQSQQHYLPELSEPLQLAEVLKKYCNIDHRFIAHCIPDQERQPLSALLQPGTETVIIIGPEGDFRFDEVSLSISYGFKPVSLGTQRLRTETAAMSVCAHFNLINDGKE